MRRQVLLFIATAAFAHSLFADGRTFSRGEVEAVVARVVETFTGQSEKPIAAIRKFGDVDESTTWEEAVRSFPHVDVAGWHVDPVWGPPGTVTAHLTMRVTATTWNGAQVWFPPKWTIRIQDDGGRAVIAAIATDESALAYQMLPEQSDADRVCLLQSRPDLDPQRVLKLLADDLANAGKAKQSEDAYVFGFRWARQHHDVDLENRCAGLGSTRALMSDDPSLAIALAEAAIDLAAHGTDPDAAAMSRFAAGIARWRAGQLDGALRDLRTSADQIDSLRRPTVALQSEYMYAYIEETRGDIRQAVESAQRLGRESHAFHWTHGELLADWLIADSESSLHHDEVAREYHRRVMEGFRQVGDEEEMNLAFADLAHDEVELGSLSAARDLLQEVLRRLPDAYTSIATSATLSHVLVQLGKYDEAEQVLDRSESIKTPDPAQRSHTALARSELAFARKRYEDAETFARSAISMSATPGSMEIFPSLGPAQTALARALTPLGRFDDAELAYRDAISTVEAELGATPADDLSRVRLYDDKAAPYRGLAGLLAARGKAADALALTEAIRARGLREMVEQGKIDLDADLTPAEKTEKQALEARLTEKTRGSIGAAAAAPVRRDLEQARLALEDFNTVVAVRHGRAYSGTAVSRSDIARGEYLRPDEAAIEYLVEEERTLAFLITRKNKQARVRVLTLPIGSRHLRVIVNRLAGAIRQRDLRWAAASRAVYDAVIRPLEPELASFRHICVIPDGDLWSVPFDVLRDDHGVALIEKATISYSPSLLMLRDMRRGRPAGGPRTLLAMANPTINSGTTALVRSIDSNAPLGALPDAEREVEKLRDLYGRSHADVRVGAAALESVFKREAGEFSVLHIATHGMLDDHSPIYSCLVLAPDAHDDGLLEMREIVNLDLHADLAVLSACDTARGQISRGEGVVGLSWAFLAAGCPTTVVSQWKVDSAATEQLMIAFHRDLIESNFRSAADALRRAKLALMKDPRYRHPFYWAPFIVVGKS